MTIYEATPGETTNDIQVGVDGRLLAACTARMSAASARPVSTSAVLNVALVALARMQADGFEFVEGRRFDAIRRDGDTVTFWTIDSDGALEERGSTSWPDA